MDLFCVLVHLLTAATGKQIVGDITWEQTRSSLAANGETKCGMISVVETKNKRKENKKKINGQIYHFLISVTVWEAR